MKILLTFGLTKLLNLAYTPIKYMIIISNKIILKLYNKKIPL